LRKFNIQWNQFAKAKNNTLSASIFTMSATKEILPGITIHPQIIGTALGKVEFELTEGDGPVVLASHGGIGGVDQARLLLNWLDPTQYRLLSLSRPGYLNTPLSSGKSFEAQADLFAALLDALQIEQAAVITISAGGPPGYQFAVRYPNRIWALVAIASVSGRYHTPETVGPVTQALFMSQWGQTFVKKIARRKPAWLLQEMFKGTGYYDKHQLQAHIDFSLRSPEALNFAHALIDSMNPFEPRKAGNDNDAVQLQQLTHGPLRQVRCPTLIIHGTHDADVKFYDGVYAYENIPGAERFWIEYESHLGFWLSPDASKAQEVAREFLRRHRPLS
jgi:pimeloyl-ACP methyl ester carboxylesterase